MVLADADAYTDDMDLTNCFLASLSIADASAIKLGATSAIKLVAYSAYRDFCSLVNDNWADISEYAKKKHPYYVNSADSIDEKIKRRAAFCILLSFTESEINRLHNKDKWSSINDRLLVVLQLLEIAGCFILRKGAVESYYQASDIYTSEGKPTAAIEEIGYLDQLAIPEINEKLADLIRCIEHASEGKRIDEAESLRDIQLFYSCTSSC